MFPADVEHQPDRASVARAMNDLEAARARVERDARLVYDDTRNNLVMQLLPVLDNLDRTIEVGTDPAMIQGVQIVRAQLETVLRNYGIERIDAAGAPFDPGRHEAIGVEPVRDPADHGRVLDQVQPGYRFGDRLLRPAKVVVGRSIA